MEARNRSLSDWLTRVRTRQVVLPRFQRFEAWTYRHVTSLLDTVLRELPAGALLVLEVGDSERFVSRTMEGAPVDGERVSEQLLDGQQRLTALWRSLTDDYPDRSFFIETQRAAPDEDAERDDFPRAVSFARWERDGRRYPLWIDDPEQTWRRGMIPVHLLRPDPKAEATFEAWAQRATAGDPQALMSLFRLGTELRGRFAHFNLPFLSLPASTGPETALDVFVKMNTSAQPLSTYDVVVAQVEAATGFSLHELVEDLRREVPGLDHFGDPADVILSAAAYHQDRPARRGVMLGDGFSESLIENWDLIVSGARRAVAFLDEEGVFDSARLPTDPVLPLLVALWGYAPDGLDAEGNARALLRRFLWRSFLTDRYERASNTRALADFKTMRARLLSEDLGEPALFDDELHPLPTIDEILLAGWPKKKERLARALTLVTLKQGGFDLADGSRATRGTLLRREYHHLFPVAFLREREVPERSIFRALNCALITWKTNRNIAAKAPAEYIRQRTGASSLGEAEIRRRLESHLIDYDLLSSGDYDRFLEDRAARVSDEIRRLCDWPSCGGGSEHLDQVEALLQET